MLPKHCKLIMVVNIYYMTAGGLYGRDVRQRERAGERNAGLILRIIIMITHWVSQGMTAVHELHREAARKLGQTKNTTDLCLIR